MSLAVGAPQNGDYLPPETTSTAGSMGNSASSTRKSAAALRHAAAYRKSSQSEAASNNLEEEFSTLILHEVKRQQNADTREQPATSVQPDKRINQMEDEFNELNGDLLDHEIYAVERNILPDDASDTMQVDAADDTMAEHDNGLVDLVSDLTKVDFTRIADPAVARQPLARSTSTFSAKETGSGSVVGSASAVDSAAGSVPGSGAISSNPALVPVEIKWVNLQKQPIGKVSIIGLFSNWRDVIKLKRLQLYPNEYSTTVRLPLGVHKLLYIVNNEYRVLDQLPTATDQEGIFFNWFEVLDPHRLFNQSQHPHSDASSGYDANIIQVAGQYDALLIQKKSNSFLSRVTREEKDLPQHVEVVPDAGELEEQFVPYLSHSELSLGQERTQPEEEFSSEIPEMFVNYDYFKTMAPNYELPEPPQLPAHLNNVLLNKMSSNQLQNHAQNIPHVGDSKRPLLRRADSSYYASNKEAYHQSIPNHVILNHLMTTSIRNGVLTVACITRYSGKFVTQIMHSPTAGMGENL